MIFISDLLIYESFLISKLLRISYKTTDSSFIMKF